MKFIIILAIGLFLFAFWNTPISKDLSAVIGTVFFIWYARSEGPRVARKTYSYNSLLSPEENERHIVQQGKTMTIVIAVILLVLLYSVLLFQ